MIPTALQRRPRRLRHPGSVETDALWLPADARTAVLDQWSPGCRLFQVGDGLVLRLPSPRRWPADSCPGLPLQDIDGRWTTAPLDPADVSAAPRGALLRLHHGGLDKVPREQWTPVDPSPWLDLRPLPVAEVTPLGSPPAPPVPVAPAVEGTVREKLRIGTVGASAVAEVAAGLARSRAVRVGLAGGGTMAAGAVEALGRLLHGLGGLFTGTAAGPSPIVPPPRGPSTLGRFLQDLGRRMGLRSALQRALAPQYARYLERMLQKLEDGLAGGDLRDALRHAIALSDAPAAGPGGWPGWLQPRDDLSLRGRGALARSTGIGVGEGLRDHLRRLYERAVERLVAEERYEEAAYVKAELLGSPGGACVLLEDHRLFRQAAELAELAELDPDLTSRLWLRAGEVDRAFAIARLHQRFGALLDGLERRELWEEATAVRHAWARREARAGDLAQAFTVAWGTPALRGLAWRWVDDALAAGGAVSAATVAAVATVSHDRSSAELLDRLAPAVDGLATGAGPAERADRERLVRGLLDGIVDGPNRRLRTLLLRRLLRPLARDVAAAPTHERKRTLRVATRQADSVLHADLPILPAHDAQAPLYRRSVPLRLDTTEADRGTLPILDAALTFRGRVLLALGETGLLLCDRHGRTLRRWAAPAHALAVAHAGTRAIVLTRRGRRWRLSRLDLSTGALSPWCDADLDHFADSFDGELWLTASGDRVSALDPDADGLRSLWGVGDLGTVIDLAAGRQDVVVVADRPGSEVEQFVWMRMGMRLHKRECFDLGTDRLSGVHWYGPLVHRASGPAAVFPGSVSHLRTGPALASQARARGEGQVVIDTVRRRGVPSVVVYTAEAHEDAVLRARIGHAGADRLGTRLQPVGERGHAVVSWDDVGRARAVDLETGELLADLRR